MDNKFLVGCWDLVFQILFIGIFSIRVEVAVEILFAMTLAMVGWLLPLAWSPCTLNIRAACSLSGEAP